MSDQNEETKSGDPIPSAPAHRMILSPVRRGAYRVLRPIAHNDVHITGGVVELSDEAAKALGDSVEKVKE